MPSPETPELDFDAWAALSARLLDLDEIDKLEILADHDLALDDWREIDRRHQDVLVADVLAGRLDRPKRYGQACAEEMARRQKAEAEQPSAGVVDEATAPAEPAAPPAPPPVTAPAPAAPPSAPELRGPPPSEPGASPGDTREMRVIRREDVARPALPFVAPAPGAPAPAIALQPATQDPRSGATMPLGVAMPVPGRALPFAGAARPEAPRPAPARALTLQEHAGLSAELALHPDRADEILHRWGVLDPQAKVTLDAEWQERLRAQPAARAEWQRAFEQYRAWLVSRGG